MKFLKSKVVFHSFVKNTVDEKDYYSVRFYNDEAELESLNYSGSLDDLNSFSEGDFVDLHCKIYRSKENYYKISGVSVYKIEKR